MLESLPGLRLCADEVAWLRSTTFLTGIHKKQNDRWPCTEVCLSLGMPGPIPLVALKASMIVEHLRLRALIELKQPDICGSKILEE